MAEAKPRKKQDLNVRVRGVVEWKDPETGIRWIVTQTKAGVEVRRWHSKTRIRITHAGLVAWATRKPIQQDLPLGMGSATSKVENGQRIP